jgi:hypothetical protein
MIRTLFCVTLLAASAAAMAGPAGMMKGAPPAWVGAALPFADAAGPNTAELLSNNYDAMGNGAGSSLTQNSYTTIASNRVKCNHAHGCSIGIETMAQVQTAGADWGICLLVDGNAVSCQYQGVQSGPSSFVVGNARGWATGVTEGFHTVDTQLYTESASATYEYFQTDVRVYKP